LLLLWAIGLLVLFVLAPSTLARIPQIRGVLQPVFNLLPGVAGYFLAMASFAFLFMSEELKRLERHRKIRIAVAALVFAVGLGAVISDSAQKTEDKTTAQTERKELMKQISTLIASAQVQATGDDIKRVGSQVQTGVDRIVSVLGGEKKLPPLAAPEKKGASLTAPEKPGPVPTIENTTLVQRSAPSSDPQLPYGLQVIIQSNVVLDPVAFALECDGEVGRVDFFIAGQGAYMNVQKGVAGPAKNTAIVRFSFPPLRPETPLVVTLLSKNQIRIVRAYKLNL
jgi:hypothetical protein